MDEFIQVATTIDDEQKARGIAAGLVERRLAACVQVLGPLQSTFRWQGKTETSREWLCVAKTRSALFAEVEAAIAELHSYDVPEILATPVCAGNADYLAWLRDELRES